jgi:hypothetical protein
VVEPVQPPLTSVAQLLNIDDNGQASKLEAYVKETFGRKLVEVCGKNFHFYNFYTITLYFRVISYF